MVPDKFIAWHAGISCWKRHKNLNENSLGIEIQNAGHSNKYPKFSTKQIRSILYLTRVLKKRYKIKSCSWDVTFSKYKTKKSYIFRSLARYI